MNIKMQIKPICKIGLSFFLNLAKEMVHKELFKLEVIANIFVILVLWETNFYYIGIILFYYCNLISTYNWSEVFLWINKQTTNETF